MVFDLENLQTYRESNRLELKSALGGLPQSLWETYSAFANTSGGVILLGVEEAPDKTLRTLPLPAPEKLTHEFWNAVNNRQKVSANILSNKHVRIVEVAGNRIVVIEVPQAGRRDKPVFVGANPFTGSYRRDGEGDYRCTRNEVQNMMRDNADISQDQRVIDDRSLDVLDYESVRRYRNRLATIRPGHVWENLDDADFLRRLGAVDIGQDEKPHPTAAGLLMFGFEYEIVREFPDYFLDYQERLDDVARWTDRFISNTGEWSGNIHDFYFHVQNKITQDIKRPFALKDGWERIDDTTVHKAIREALLNSLIHANFYERRGLVIVKERDRITIANPGNMRVSIEDAIQGGMSDPRNQTLVKMFTLLGLVERAGSGVPNIFSVWQSQGWAPPVLKEEFNPDRTTLSLTFFSGGQKVAIKSGDKKVAIKNGDNNAAIPPKPAQTKRGQKVAIKSGDKIVAIKNGDKKMAINNGDKITAIPSEPVKTKLGERQKEALLSAVAHGESIRAAQVMEMLSIGSSRARKILAELVHEDILETSGAKRDRVYRLKSKE